MSQSMTGKTVLVIFLAHFLLLGQAAKAESENSQEPEFEQFGVEVLSSDALTTTVVLSSHRYGRMFRTRLRDGAAGGVNFAGHYAAVTWGCGNECQATLIVDLRSGNVLGVAGSSEPLATARGVEFREDSRLLLADPPCPKASYEHCDCLSFGLAGTPIRYYVIEDTGLRLIGEQRCTQSR